MYKYMHVRTVHACICTYSTYVHKYMHAHTVCTSTCMYIQYVQIHACTCMYIQYVQIHACTYCTYVCVYGTECQQKALHGSTPVQGGSVVAHLESWHGQGEVPEGVKGQ